MFWFRIADWFSDMSERHKLVRGFNKAGKEAFIHGIAPTILEAKITKGSVEYRHSFSKMMSGFRIKALSGKPLSREELIEIGKAILGNPQLTRRLVALGWDTLEVHDINGIIGIKWPLKEFAQIGLMLK